MIRITSWASLSAQGAYASGQGEARISSQEKWSDGESYLAWDRERSVPLGLVDHRLVEYAASKVRSWEKGADKVTKMARWVGDQVGANRGKKDLPTGVIFASSRGAAYTLEQSVLDHSSGKRIHPATSPWTTLGSTAAWVARDLGLEGAAIDMSMTCSSGLHALYQAVALLQAGMEARMLVGASEAPLSSFGIAQFETLKVLSKSHETLPCKPFHAESGNTMVMAEGAAAMVLEIMPKSGDSLATVQSIGLGREDFEHPASISDEGLALQHSMRQALLKAGLKSVDAIICHGTGTLSGDGAEMKAIKQVFGDEIPAALSPKWKVGHTFGASGLFGIELGIHVLNGGVFSTPYPSLLSSKLDKTPQSVMVNAMGFGGNAVSVILVR